MNVYDFDNTIYNGDSTLDFYLFCLRRHPTLVRYIPRQIGSFCLYYLKLYDKTKMKEEFYCFLKGIKCVDAEIEEFWNKNIKNIKDWYLEQQKCNDIIISASPEFLLSSVCKRIGIENLIASRVDKYTGKYIGKNCRGIEKVIRLDKEYSGIEIECFYSDSLSDQPLAQKAQKAYLIRKNCIEKWPQE